MANPRLLGLFHKLVPQIGCTRLITSNMAKARKSEADDIYRAVVNKKGAQNHNAKADCKEPQKRMKGVSTGNKRNIKTANYKQASAKPIIPVEVPPPIQNIKNIMFKSPRLKIENNLKGNLESANHALLLARFKTPNRQESNDDTDNKMNLGFFLKGYQGKSTTNKGASFVDYVKKAQAQILGVSKAKADESFKPKSPDERSRKIVRTGLTRNISKQMFPATKIGNSSHSQKNVNSLPPPKTVIHRSKSATDGKEKIKPMSKPEPKQPTKKYVFYIKSVPSRMQYPKKLPTLKALNATYKEKELAEMRKQPAPLLVKKNEPSKPFKIADSPSKLHTMKAYKMFCKNPEDRSMHGKFPNTFGKRARNTQSEPIFKTRGRPIDDSLLKESRNQFNFLDSENASNKHYKIRNI